MQVYPLKLKKCQRCKVALGETEGIKTHRRVDKDGSFVYDYYCRACNTERARRYRNTENGKRRIYEAVRRSNSLNREKVNARSMLHWHVGIGNIVKPTKCEGCGSKKKLDAHHYDYSLPLEVIWVCRACHANVHKAIQDASA